MGRSVSTHRHSVCTVYLHPEFEDGDDFAWTDFVDCLREVLQEKFPSLRNADRWLDREDHIILENSRVEVSVSEYCGLVSVCLAPIDDCNGFHVAVAERLAGSFQKCLHKAFGKLALRSIGRASNGEQFFQPV